VGKLHFDDLPPIASISTKGKSSLLNLRSYAPIEATLQAAVKDPDNSDDDMYECDDNYYSSAKHEAMKPLKKICADNLIRQACRLKISYKVIQVCVAFNKAKPVSEIVLANSV